MIDEESNFNLKIMSITIKIVKSIRIRRYSSRHFSSVIVRVLEAIVKIEH